MYSSFTVKNTPLQSNNAKFINEGKSVIQQINIKMPSNSFPFLTKHRSIHKDRRTHSTVRLPPKEIHSLTNNFLQILRNISKPAHPRPSNPLISFLNIFKRQEEAVSTNYIPSIENMLSQQNINCQEQGNSKSEIQHGFSDEIHSQNTYEMRILYICLLQKIMRQLQHNTSESQRRKIIRGAWNILTKYCKDNNYQIFCNIGTKIEWGLLQLINFNFNSTPKDKYHAEQLLLQTKFAGSENSISLS